jgi:hypothetical protein
MYDLSYLRHPSPTFHLYDSFPHQSIAAKPNKPAPIIPGAAVATAPAALLDAAELASALALLARELASLMALLIEDPAAPPMPLGAVALGTGGLLTSLVIEEITEDRLELIEERVDSRPEAALEAAAEAESVVLCAVIRRGVRARRSVSAERMVAAVVVRDLRFVAFGGC